MVRPILLLLAMALGTQAQTAPYVRPTDSANLAPKLGFELPPVLGLPGGWAGGPAGTITADEKIVHTGRWSARIERSPQSARAFSSLSMSLPIEFSGSRLELRGFLRTEEVSDFAGLWLREDSESSPVAFDNMQKQHLNGTNDWHEFSIEVPIHSEANRFSFGALLSGTGKLWVDDLRLLVDGSPIWNAPRKPPALGSLEKDHDFDSGSGLQIEQLSTVQIDNLAVLGRVWGFLKYHHPKIVSGGLHWDYELLRVLPKIVAAQDRTTANLVLSQWVRSLGDLPANRTRRTVLIGSNIAVQPDVDWIFDESALGHDLSAQMVFIWQTRGAGDQFYVSKASLAGNPVFRHELGYPTISFPDSGFQLLSLFRFWNIVEYWSPYRDLSIRPWGDVLSEFVPKIALAKDIGSYRREMLALIATLGDGHANLWNALDDRPPSGECGLPAEIRFIAGRPVVTELRNGTNAGSDLRLGDTILEMEGVPVSQLLRQWRPYYAASNDAARLKDIGRAMTRGKCGPASFQVRRGDATVALSVLRVPANELAPPHTTHDLPGPPFRLLPEGVAYLKLSEVRAADVSDYVNRARNTKGFIFDLRNYPAEFVAIDLGSLLVDRQTAFVRFTECDFGTPGAFRWAEPLALTPRSPHYSGKVVILVDEITMSQAEYTAMAFRAGAGARVVGSTTAGADGNASPFSLPGGLQTMITGLGVFYPDKTPTQQVGILPDVLVTPTIPGIQSGRDEVLDEAVNLILAGSRTP